MCTSVVRRLCFDRVGDLRAELLAFAQCMRAHGVPNFPDPTNSSERFHISGHPKVKVTGPMAQANKACEHLLPPGSVTTSSGQ